ncbi:hypothetical protein ACSHWB_23510 [Lentzea sp. HUAS TT2]|uniref:hypothetical protein n=1 Tax=Lentzea sp. HUAS TT2 TaxID=3447454 RepID=UPI003F71CF5E
MARTSGIVMVVDRARGTQPYVIAVDFRRVFRQISPTEMEGLPLWEAQLVTHLLETGEFDRDTKILSLTCDGCTNRVVALEAPRHRDVEVRPGSAFNKGGDVR